jgi:hypothetical protein
MAYITISDLRAEGVSAVTYPDPVVQDAIDFAQETVETVTLKYFEPRTDTRYFDGTGHEILKLDMPIVTLTKVEWQQFGASDWIDRTLTDFKAYNRVPQDHYYPKLAIFRSSSYDIESRTFGYFPEGTLNVRVTGQWGWLEKNASGALVTPKQIQKACKILAVVWMDQIGDGSLLAVLRSYGLIEEKTDRHSYKLNAGLTQGGLTGIPMVDMLLSKFISLNQVTFV